VGGEAPNRIGKSAKYLSPGYEGFGPWLHLVLPTYSLQRIFVGVFLLCGVVKFGFFNIPRQVLAPALTVVKRGMRWGGGGDLLWAFLVVKGGMKMVGKCMMGNKLLRKKKCFEKIKGGG